MRYSIIKYLLLGFICIVITWSIGAFLRFDYLEVVVKIVGIAMLIAYVIIIGYETKNWYASPHTILHVSIPIVLLSAALSLSEYIYMKYFHWDMMIHNYTNTSGYLDPLYRNQLMEEASRAEEIARHNAFSGFTILLAVGVLSVFVALVIYRNKTK